MAIEVINASVVTKLKDVPRGELVRIGKSVYIKEHSKENCKV